jgi:hypothetical protein
MSDSQTDPQPVQRYEALLEATEPLTRCDDLSALFHELAQRLKKVVPFDLMSVFLYDPADHVMRLYILQSDRPLNTGLGPDHAPSASPGGWVRQSQEPMIMRYLCHSEQ